MTGILELAKMLWFFQIETEVKTMDENYRYIIKTDGIPLRQTMAVRGRHGSVVPRNRIAVRVAVRIFEGGIDAVDQQVADRVFHILGLFVDLVPGQVECFDQEQLDQEVPPENP